MQCDKPLDGSRDEAPSYINGQNIIFVVCCCHNGMVVYVVLLNYAGQAGDGRRQLGPIVVVLPLPLID